MKFCVKCGREIEDYVTFCEHCGAEQNANTVDSVQPQNTYELPKTEAASSADGSSFGYAVLGFCIPIVGLILYLVWKDEKPLRAKSAGKGALVSVIVSVVLYAIYAVLIGALMVTGM